MGYTRLQKRTEIARELAMRRRVYPRMVAEGRMSQDEAERLIDIMESIWSDYEEAADRRQKELPFRS
jgi:polyhydroxyalkanoate synthesis regulator phasin